MDIPLYTSITSKLLILYSTLQLLWVVVPYRLEDVGRNWSVQVYFRHNSQVFSIQLVGLIAEETVSMDGQWY